MNIHHAPARDLKVLIIGGGTGGACLAHGLKRSTLR